MQVSSKNTSRIAADVTAVADRLLQMFRCCVAAVVSSLLQCNVTYNEVLHCCCLDALLHCHCIFTATASRCSFSCAHRVRFALVGLAHPKPITPLCYCQREHPLGCMADVNAYTIPCPIKGWHPMWAPFCPVFLSVCLSVPFPLSWP